MISFYLTVLDEGEKVADVVHLPRFRPAMKRRIRGIPRRRELGEAEPRHRRLPRLEGQQPRRTIEPRRGCLPDPHGKPEEKYVYVTHVSGEGVVRFHRPTDCIGSATRKRSCRLCPTRRTSRFGTGNWGAMFCTCVATTRARSWTWRLRNVVRLPLDTLSSPAGVMPSVEGPDARSPKGLPHIVDEMPVVFAADRPRLAQHRRL